MAPRTMSFGAMDKGLIQSGLIGGGHPLLPTRIGVIESYVQGYQQDHRLIGSIDSIV